MLHRATVTGDRWEAAPIGNPTGKTTGITRYEIAGAPVASDFVNQNSLLYNGICEVCHIADIACVSPTGLPRETKFFRKNDDDGETVVGFHAVESCTNCHTHTNTMDSATGFKKPNLNSNPNCGMCHIDDNVSTPNNDDYDDYTYDLCGDSKALIDGTQWSTTGHGVRTGDALPETSLGLNPNKPFNQSPSSDYEITACVSQDADTKDEAINGCHDEEIDHAESGLADNKFRLVAVATIPIPNPTGKEIIYNLCTIRTVIVQMKTVRWVESLILVQTPLCSKGR